MAPAFFLRLRLWHVRHNGGRDVGSLALQQPFAGFLTALSGLPMRGVFGVAGQNQLGLLTPTQRRPAAVTSIKYG